MQIMPDIASLSFGIIWLFMSIAFAFLWGSVQRAEADEFRPASLADHYEPWDNDPTTWKMAPAYDSSPEQMLAVESEVSLSPAMPMPPSIVLEETVPLAAPPPVVPGLRVVWSRPHPRRLSAQTGIKRAVWPQSLKGQVQGRFLRSADKSAISLDIRQAFSPRSWMP